MRLRITSGLVLLLLAACATGRRVGDPDLGRPRDSGPAADLASLDSGSRMDGAPGDGGGMDGGGMDGGGMDGGGVDGGGMDAGHDAGALDAGHDAGSIDAAPVDFGPGTAATVMFPTMTSTVCSMGTCGALGAGGGGAYYQSGDYLDETVTLRAPSISRLAVMFTMSDLTGGCAVGASHNFDVSVNGTRVGSYSFSTGSAPAMTRTIMMTYAFAAIAGTGGGTQYDVRLTATTTVCSGGSSWNWIPGGTATGTSP